MSGASRRDALASLAGFLAVPALASGEAASAHPDAALFAWAPALAALKAEMDAREADMRRAEARLERMHPHRDVRGLPDDKEARERWRAAKAASGYDAAWAAFEEAVEPLIEALSALGEMRAGTIAGLCLKAQYAEHYEGLADSIVDDLCAIGAGRQA